jgi:hypothetical protein
VRLRLGPGPVFVYEWLTTSRRWQLYTSRAAFVLAILAGMMLISRMDHNRRLAMGQGEFSIKEYAAYGQTLFLTVASIELAVVLLVAPAATAGAVCLDKMRGTLDHMLATDLSNAEIVLGKLGSRLVPVFGLICCVLPIMALAGLLGGIDPHALFGSFLTAIGCAVLGCSLALMLSVWGRKPHEVLTVTYLLVLLWLFSPYLTATAFNALGYSAAMFLSLPVWDWLAWSNPFTLVWAPYSRPGSVSLFSYVMFLICCIGISGIFAAVATLRIRAVAANQSGRASRSGILKRLAGILPSLRWRRLLPGPTLDGNPVFWREWHWSKPSRFMRLASVMYTAFGLGSIAIALQAVLTSDANREIFAMLNVLLVGVGLLLLSVNAATSLAEERMRSSLDVLLTTPLSTLSILAGKWAGAFGSVPLLLFAPAATTFVLATSSGRWIQWFFFMLLLLAYCAVIISTGLAMATWQSRLGRAVASCVAVYVAMSIGWPAIVLALTLGAGADDSLILPLIFGTPLYGTAFGTIAVLSDSESRIPGGVYAIWIGTILWITIYSALAAILFAATVATFDRCLGRMREYGRPGAPRPLKKWPRSFVPELNDELLPDEALHPLDPAPG